MTAGSFWRLKPILTSRFLPIRFAQGRLLRCGMEIQKARCWSVFPFTLRKGLRRMGHPARKRIRQGLKPLVFGGG